MAGNAWRDIGGAREALGTGDGVVCSGARCSELKLTCKIRAAWAGLSGVRQERFQASCHVPEVLSSVSEVLVRIPGVLGVPGCCCLLYHGGS